MLELLQKLSPLSGVSSRETPVRECIRAIAEPFVDEAHVDSFGNLILFKKGKKSIRNGVLIDAGMDETGVMVSGFTDSGALRFQTVGNLDRRNLIGKKVYLGQERVLGVFGMKPIHLSTKEERKSVPKEKELYLDIGCTNRKDAEAQIPLGTVGVFEDVCGLFGEDLFYGKALRSRTGCAVLLKLLQEELPIDCTFVFSAQREVGARGAFGSAFSVRPQMALTLDGFPAEDYPGIEPEDVCSVGNGPVLSRYCPRIGLDRMLFEMIKGCAEASSIPFQIQGTTSVQDGAGIYATRGAGCRVAALSIPVRYQKSPIGVVSLKDCQRTLDLTRVFLDQVTDCLERGV